MLCKGNWVIAFNKLFPIIRIWDSVSIQDSSQNLMFHIFKQVSVEYNVPALEVPKAFEVKVFVHRREKRDEEEITSCNPLRLKIKAK